MKFGNTCDSAWMYHLSLMRECVCEMFGMNCACSSLVVSFFCLAVSTMIHESVCILMFPRVLVKIEYTFNYVTELVWIWIVDESDF